MAGVVRLSIIRPMTASNLLYSAAQVRALDAYAIAQGTSGYTLMKRAGETALRALRSRWPTALEIAVVAGGGNNGGDGYVLARFAQAAGLSVTVLAVIAPGQLNGDARSACQDFRSQRRAHCALFCGAARAGGGDRRCAARHRAVERGACAAR